MRFKYLTFPTVSMLRALISVAVVNIIVFFSSFASSPVAPLGSAKWTHAPYDDGSCGICHQSDDVNNPGNITAPVNTLCFMCHSEIEELLSKRRHTHKAAQANCTSCHNPHNSDYKFLLLEAAPTLCTKCHTDIGKRISKMLTKHGAVDSEKGCMNCHDPHATKVQKLLKALPYTLCVNCHSRDDIVDHNGKKLMNIKEHLRTRPYLHGPVAGEDCSACHNPHGEDYFRLLVASYPDTFYSEYNPENYQLCFTCHDDSIVNVEETVNLTDFRDKSRNLHFLHVNRPKGRTCRACHEVHAGERPHIIRDGVPFGSRGWVLKINYEKLPQGGRCSKTCHGTKEYHR